MMNKAFSLFSISGLLPNISLEVTTKQSNDVAVFHFVCKTKIPPIACSVVYLQNDHTVTNLRLVNASCINNDAICTPDICSCSKDCNVFTLNLEATSVVLNSIFGCEARLNDSGFIFSAREVQKFDGKGKVIN